MKKLMILSIIGVALACSKNIHRPVKHYEKDHSISATRHRSDEALVIFKKEPTSADRKTIKTSLANTGIDTAALTVRKCNSCKDAYVELWQVDNIDTMIRDDNVGGGTVSDRGKAVGENGMAYFSVNFISNVPVDAKLNFESYNETPLEFSGAGKKTITVAVLDTGIDTTRVVSPTLVWKNVGEKTNEIDDDRNCYADDTRGWNFVDDNSNVADNNDNFHGTLVSHYIINEFERSSRNFVQIMSLKTHDASGEGDLFSSICAIHYAMNNKANIINASWGFYYYTKGRPHPYLDKLITETLRERGILFVTAAGNADEEADNLVKAAYKDRYGFDIPVEMLRNLEFHNFYPGCLSRTGKNVITVTTTDGTAVSPTQNYSEQYVDIGVLADVNDTEAMRFQTPFPGTTSLISGSSYATAIACGKIGAYLPKEMYRPGLNKHAVFEQLQAITPAARPPLITYEPVLEKHLIRNGKKTYPK